MAKKHLPYISISGTQDELIPIEMILTWLGYESKEWWNNYDIVVIKDDLHIIASELCRYEYYNHSGFGNPKRFKASQLEQIIDYVLNYKPKPHEG